MKFIETDIPDVKILEPAVFGDERGFFMETFRADEFVQQTGAKPFVQDNHSKSAQGILRGLHYQLEHTQGKLVRVVAGAVFDVAVPGDQIAGVLKDLEQGRIGSGSTIVCTLTGHGLKDPDTAIAQCVKPQTVDAELPEIERVIRAALKT